MLIADKHYLKANLSRGWLATQSNLINLYTTNLQAFGTMAAFVAGCAFMGIAELRMPKARFRWTGLNYLYDIFIHLALCLSIFATTQSVLVVVYGPSIALKGAEDDAVIIVANELQYQRRKIMFIGGLAILSLYFSLISNYWAKVPLPTVIVTTFLLLFGVGLTVFEGIRCYNRFHPGREVYFSDIFGINYFFISLILLLIMYFIWIGRKSPEKTKQDKYHLVHTGVFDDNIDVMTPKSLSSAVGNGGSVIGGGDPSESFSDTKSDIDPTFVALLEERKQLLKVDKF